MSELQNARVKVVGGKILGGFFFKTLTTFSYNF